MRLAEKKRDKALVGLWHDNISLFMPLTYMNLSGAAVAPFSKRNGILPSQILVFHDELDFPCGKVRFKKGGGEGGHNGLRSISSHLRTQDYWRLRIGVGKPPHKDEGQRYVLQAPLLAEMRTFTEILPPVLAAITEFVTGDKEKAMRELHTSG